MAVNGAPKQPVCNLSSEYLPLCSAEQRHSYRFRMNWGWVNDDRIVISGWTIPLKHHHVMWRRRFRHVNKLFSLNDQTKHHYLFKSLFNGVMNAETKKLIVSFVCMYLLFSALLCSDRRHQQSVLLQTNVRSAIQSLSALHKNRAYDTADKLSKSLILSHLQTMNGITYIQINPTQHHPEGVYTSILTVH